MGTHVCLAGAEDVKALDMFSEIGIPNVLVSYYYLRKKGIDSIKEKLKGFELVLCDSGAFTFLSGNNTLSYEGMDAYVSAYADFIAKYKEYFSIFVEMDLYAMDRYYKGVDEWRERLITAAGGREKVMPIFHSKLAKIPQNWEQMCKDFPYVGMGSKYAQNATVLTPLFSVSKKYGTKVHGMGITKLDIIRHTAYYSVDSTSWSMGQRYGITYELRGSMMKSWAKYHKDSVRKRMLNRYKQRGLDANKILADDPEEVMKANLLEWKDFIIMVDKTVNRGQTQDHVSDVEEVVATVEEKEYTFDEMLDLATPKGQIKYFDTQLDRWVPGFIDIIDRETEGKEVFHLIDQKGVKFAVNRIDFDEGWKLAPITALSIANMDVRVKSEKAVEILMCDSCYVSGRCPFAKPGATCSVEWAGEQKEKGFDLKTAILDVISEEYKRVKRSLFFENIDGGVLDQNVSKEVSNFIHLLEMFKNIVDNRDEVIIKAKGKGIISQLFGGNKPDD